MQCWSFPFPLRNFFPTINSFPSVCFRVKEKSSLCLRVCYILPINLCKTVAFPLQSLIALYQGDWQREIIGKLCLQQFTSLPNYQLYKQRYDPFSQFPITKRQRGYDLHIISYLFMCFHTTQANCINIDMIPLQDKLWYPANLQDQRDKMSEKRRDKIHVTKLHENGGTSLGIVAENNKDWRWRGTESTIFSMSFRNPKSNKWSASSSASIFKPIKRTEKPDLFSMWSSSLPGVATIICKVFGISTNIIKLFNKQQHNWHMVNDEKADVQPNLAHWNKKVDKRRE